MNKKIGVVFLILLLAISTVFSASGLIAAMSQLCKDAKSLMLIAMFLMILLAAITYAAGQMMGAETRARATVWATAMFTGALFAGIIFAITPKAIEMITATSLATCA